jgi:hypothetical protein
MKGVVELLGPRHGMIGVRTENDDYSVLELCGGYSLELGDILIGELDSLGGEEVKNITQDEVWDVFIQDIYASKQSAWNLISQH